MQSGQNKFSARAPRLLFAFRVPDNANLTVARGISIEEMEIVEHISIRLIKTKRQ